jgi:formylglycine-generating enzyme required for sulfatase activity
MKTFLRPLCLWLTIASLISPLLGQSVRELELETSSNLNVWESVTITPEMISDTGRLIVPTNGSKQFYRMKVLMPPAGMALIPAGAFTMGDSLDGLSDAPTRTVTLDAFYIGKYEVTKAEWDEVRTWGLNNGYTDLATGSGKADNHPVQSISWYDMVKWCNARSQKEGLTAVYYTNDEQTTIYKTGNVDETNAQVMWSANGYRLPTEAEWEKAARGSLEGKRFSWGDTVSHSQANYKSSSTLDYDLSGALNDFHPNYAAGATPYTSPVGSFSVNGYGLYDMMGNVFEWCWDRYGSYDSLSEINPRGATSGSYRVFRGGNFDSTAYYMRTAQRNPANNSAGSSIGVGLRVARSLVP